MVTGLTSQQAERSEERNNDKEQQIESHLRGVFLILVISLMIIERSVSK